MKKEKTWQGKTAEEIIEGRDGETNGGMNMSGDIVWQYRTHYNADGTLQGFGMSTACDEEDADCIGVEEAGAGVVAILDI